jgi:hypothetical protein
MIVEAHPVIDPLRASLPPERHAGQSMSGLVTV